MTKPTVLFGPEPSKNPLNSGSWKWFGIDLANELRQYYNIITQKNAEPLKKADCYLSIKSLEFAKRIGQRDRSIYVVVDKFRTVEEIAICAKYSCRMTILNNEQLWRNYFINAKNNHYGMFIPHHIKYFYDGYVYQPESSIFWQGMLGNYRHFREYIEKNILSKHIKILLSGKERDPGKQWNSFYFMQNFHARTHYAWTEEHSEKFMKTCSGFLDIKGDDFHQRYKPATKVLDAIASGVPTAINECGVRDYMASLGMTLAYPTDTAYWFSREYFDLTQQWKEIIRRDFHVEKVALQYKEVIDNLLEN